MDIFVLEIIVIELCFVGGFSIKEESELGFISIKVSFLVLWFSIFCCSTDIFCNILVSTYYNTYGTLQVVSELFPLHKLWDFFSRVEACIFFVLKAQWFVTQWVKLRLWKTTCKKYKRFHVVTQKKCLTLFKTSITHVGMPLSSTTSDRICT